MPLAVGTRLGPYEIVAPLGAGGMGEVYRAKDTRLDRTVAIKVLPSHLSSNTEFKQRFEREARTISSLSHPNICALYDIGEQDGIDYLVMELLEGETLAQRINKGALPMDQVLRYGMQIADALDKAHRQGIVHRDLKPGNIMITKSGVKLLDFGLAKLQGPVIQQIAGVSTLPTEQHSLTAEGSIIGTLQYMSPEQLEGGEADARTDIFAMGIVLYEMAAGRHAFTGKSQASLIAAILSSEPQPISAIQPMTPAAFDRVVKTCMAKDREDRWQTAHDVMLELRWIMEAGSQPALSAPVFKHRKNRERLAWLAAIVLPILSAILTFLILHGREKPFHPQVIETALYFPPDQAMDQTSLWAGYAISPDGRRIVYDRRTASGLGLYLRNLDQPESNFIPGTLGAVLPFFSPDGQSIGFLAADGKIKTTSLKSGTPVTICDTQHYDGADWGKGGTIIFSDGGNLYAVNASGGTPRILLQPDKPSIRYLSPYLLPDASGLLLTIETDNNDSVAILPLKDGNPSGSPHVLLDHAINAKYVYPGYLLYLYEQKLYFAPFDLSKKKVTGPVSIGMDYVASTQGFSVFDISPTGTLIYSAGNFLELRSLTWVDRHGVEMLVDLPNRPYADPSISPDGKRLAFAIQEENQSQQIWIRDSEKGAVTRLTFEKKYHMAPVWSLDGKKLAYTVDPPRRIYVRAADGTGEETVISPLSQQSLIPFAFFPTSWSPDGHVLAVIWVSKTADILTLNCEEPFAVSGKCNYEKYLATDSNETIPMISPDGRWLAYVSDESGQNEIYVQSFPKTGEGKWQISLDGGKEPRWSHKGDELFFRQGNKMMVSAVHASSSFSADKPKILFQGEYDDESGVDNYDVAPDGQSFLMLKKQSPIVQTPIHLILNFNEKLRQIESKTE